MGFTNVRMGYIAGVHNFSSEIGGLFEKTAEINQRRGEELRAGVDISENEREQWFTIKALDTAKFEQT